MRWNSLWSRQPRNRSRTAHLAVRPRLEALEDRSVPAVLFVNTGADSGMGSLRAAIEQANINNSIDTIIVKNSVSIVSLGSSLSYTGAQTLNIKGHGTTIQPMSGSEGSFDLLEATGGADLTFDSLTFQNGLKNIDVIVPAGATGMLSVNLKHMTVRHSVEHGLHVDDLTNASAAGIRLDVQGSAILSNGSDPDDFDGIRVDERGSGDIVATFRDSIAANNGGDGVELDERDDGSVLADIRNSAFNRNGYANAGDLEDGFDIDEGGRGDIIANMANARFSDNFEGGLDVNEDDGEDPTDSGNLIVRLVNVDGSDNDDKGLDFNEGDSGHLIADFVNVEASRNGTFTGNLEEGIVLEEFGSGGIVTSFRNVTASGNGDDGIDIDETGDGDFVGTFVNVTASDSGVEGIDIDEEGEGVFFINLVNILSNDPLDVTD